jgi:hypothetical protein
MIWVKSHKAWTLKLESVQEPEVQSDETGGDTGAIREVEPEAVLVRFPRALQASYIKMQLIIYVIYVVLH